MASIVLYFQVHQPYRLQRYSVFDTHTDYFDHVRNREVLLKVVQNCYRPATELLLKLVQRHEGAFALSFSLTGTVIEQLEQYAPDVLDLFRQLAETGACEFLAETYCHSLASLYSPDEFLAQIDLHSRCMRERFGLEPRIFRNTELIYSNDIAATIAQVTDGRGQPRFLGMLAEGVDHLLEQRSPNVIFQPALPGITRTAPFGLLLRNYRLSDDIAFRFSNQGWDQWPLTADKFARWLDELPPRDQVCNLFMDYETFGEHQWAQSGIFDFLEALPGRILAAGRHRFLTPSAALAAHEPLSAYDAPLPTSWADTQRDLSAWLGNALQTAAAEALYRLEPAIRSLSRTNSSPEAHTLCRDWRRLSTSDHLYYMCTKYFSDGDVHRYFNPYESPYEAFINCMNVLESLQTRLTALTAVPPKRSAPAT